MKPPQDPPRLLEPGSDAPAWLRSSLDAGVRDVPGPKRLARIAAGLPHGPVGPGGGDPGPGPTQPRPPLSPLSPGLPSVFSGAAIGAALGLAVVGAGWLVSPRAADPPPPPRAAPIAAVTAAVPAPLQPGPAKAPARRARAPVERPEPLPSVAAGPAASAGSEPPGPAVATGPEPGPSSAEPDPPAAETESAILQRAQDALNGDPARALALTDLHLARFPGGGLAQEREVLAVAALLRMGRSADARARATRFAASFPTSAHRRRLEVLIPDLESSAGVHKDPGERPSTP
jgi:hypothetical protein